MVPAKAVTVRMPYEGPAAGTYGGPADCGDPLRGMGLVCLDVARQAATLDLAVADQSGLPIGGHYYLHDAAGNDLAAGAFCGSASIPVVAGTVKAAVRLDAVNGPIACLDAGETATGPATKGIVALRLR